MEKLIERYPDGAPERVIARALGITEDEVRETLARTVGLLKESLS